jgi:hypothetical protein
MRNLPRFAMLWSKLFGQARFSSLAPDRYSCAAIKLAEQGGAEVIAGGPCTLVKLRFRDE